MHYAYHQLKDCAISVEDMGAEWLMTCRRRRKPKMQIAVNKADVSEEKIQAHARTTFAALLAKPGGR